MKNVRRIEPYIVGLDTGTSHVAVVVAAVDPLGGLEVLGTGKTRSRGLRQGVIVNMDQTVDSIRAAIEEAELVSGIHIEGVSVGIAGIHVRGFNSRGVIATGHRGRRIGPEDMGRVTEAARQIAIPRDREILHVLPQEFVVDDQPGIGDPQGMSGSRLEAQVHVVTASTSAVHNLISCVERAEVQVRNLVLEQLAVSEAVLTHDEKELGVALVDVGGGTTDLAVFQRGAVLHTAVLPTGGDHFTNDIAVGLRTPIPEAEKIKRSYGCAVQSLIEEDEAIQVPSVGNRKPRVLSRKLLCEILQPRAEEIARLLEEEVSRVGLERELNAGLVLTGGGAELEGLAEVLEAVFNLPCRKGTPMGLSGVVEDFRSPSFALAAGLVLHSFRNRERTQDVARSRKWGAVGHRIRSWFSEML
jgi:cell division protein FtsA